MKACRRITGILLALLLTVNFGNGFAAYGWNSGESGEYRPYPILAMIPTLREGDYGEEVELLQWYLMFYGYFDGEIDGYYDDAMEDAVRMFQKFNGLRQTGNANYFTKNLIFSGEINAYAFPEAEAFAMQCSTREIVKNLLTVEEATESSYFTDRYFDYVAEYVLDNDDTHCWAACGERIDDVGEWIELSLEEKRMISGFSIKTGYHYDERRFYGNYRPRMLAVYADEHFLGEVELDDRMERQYIRFSEPVLANSLRFEIVSVYPTNRDEDACITSIKLYSAF